jgi:hypothetical protein
MAEEGNLPSLPITVDVSGNSTPIDMSDPLEFMRQVARKYIDVIGRNQIPNDEEKVEFKKWVLHKLKENISKFKEIDLQAAKKEKEKQAKEAADKIDSEEEEDPFADIFADDEDETSDEFVIEKTKIATKFEKNLKEHKEKFLKSIRVNREKASQKADEENLEDILEQLETI